MLFKHVIILSTFAVIGFGVNATPIHKRESIDISPPFSLNCDVTGENCTLEMTDVLEEGIPDEGEVECTTDEDCQDGSLCDTGKCVLETDESEDDTEEENVELCLWEGHCLGDVCVTSDDCDGTLICSSKLCATAVDGEDDTEGDDEEDDTEDDEECCGC